MTQQSKDQFHDAAQSDPKSEDLFPSTDNWNCVLKCWSRNTDPSRAFHSFAFLRSWMEFNEFCQSSVGLGEKVGAQCSQPNVESYRVLLQSCLSEQFHGNSDADIQRAKEIGSGIAIKIWNELQRTGVRIDSELYFKVIKCICQASDLPSESSKSRSLTALVRVFTHCTKENKATTQISDLVRSNMTVSQYTLFEGNQRNLNHLE